MPDAWIDRIRVLNDGSFETECFFCNQALLVFPDDAVGVVFGPDGDVVGMQCQVCTGLPSEQRIEHFKEKGML